MFANGGRLGPGGMRYNTRYGYRPQLGDLGGPSFNVKKFVRNPVGTVKEAVHDVWESGEEWCQDTIPGTIRDIYGAVIPIIISPLTLAIPKERENLVTSGVAPVATSVVALIPGAQPVAGIMALGTGLMTAEQQVKQMKDAEEQAKEEAEQAAQDAAALQAMAQAQSQANTGVQDSGTIFGLPTPWVIGGVVLFLLLR